VSRKWINSLLRARQAQEDIARERLAHARMHAQDARQRVYAEDQRVAAMLEERSPASARAFVAAVSARQAAAATLSGARQTQAMADDQVVTRTTSVVSAARDRRSIERLAERDAADLHTRTIGALQKELDDIGVGRHQPGIAAAGG
jgi:precorrin-4 methylase